MIFIEELPSLFEYHKTTKQQNLQAISIWITNQKFIIVPNLNRSRIPTILQIDRKNKSIKELTEFVKEKYSSAKEHIFSCLLGIINLKGKRAIILAEQVNIVASIGMRDIFKITKPIYLFYDPKEKQSLTQQQAEILLNVTTIFQQGMYFSFSYDLALSLNSSLGENQQKEHFNWAHHIQKQLESFDHLWRISVIQGFVGRMEVHLNGLRICIVLISRRAVKRGGTQTYARGIDKQGNAGNYVQTQQILVMKDHYFSFVLVRGTVPLFWREIKSSYGFSNIKFSGTITQNYSSFKNHLSILSKHSSYKNLYLLNLLSVSKQQKLIQNYEYLTRKYERELKQNQKKEFNLKYVFFDLHKECNNKNYFKLNQFLEGKMEAIIRNCHFTAVKIDRVARKIEIIDTQSGVIRLNCFNCIDRSNIAESRIAALKLMDILKYLNIQVKEFSEKLKFMSRDSPFSNLYRNLWADNSDALSKQYTGTGSTESFAERKGKLSYLTTLDHGMKSIFRAIRNFRNEDEKKQQAIKFLLGGHIQKQSSQQLVEVNSRTNPKSENSSNDLYVYQKLQDKESVQK